jgi:hypothetical protein
MTVTAESLPALSSTGGSPALIVRSWPPPLRAVTLRRKVGVIENGHKGLKKMLPKARLKAERSEAVSDSSKGVFCTMDTEVSLQRRCAVVEVRDKV